MSATNIVAWQPTGNSWSEGWMRMIASVGMCGRQNLDPNMKIIWSRESSGTHWVCIRDYQIHFPGQGSSKRCIKLCCLHSSGSNSLIGVVSTVMRNLLLVFGVNPWRWLGCLESCHRIDLMSTVDQMLWDRAIHSLYRACAKKGWRVFSHSSG